MDGYVPVSFREFLERFNNGLYWESHEVLEGEWRKNRSRFYQGLIILASAYVHQQRGKPSSYLKQLQKARLYLEPYLPTYLGLDVAALLQVIDTSLASASLSQNPVAAPLLVVRPEHLRGTEPELQSPNIEPVRPARSVRPPS